MLRQLRRAVGSIILLLVLQACQDSGDADDGPDQPAPSNQPSTTVTEPEAAPALMPDLTGLPSARAGRRIGALEASARLGISSSWHQPIAIRCDVRPGTVVRQKPPAGTELERGIEIQIWTGELDLDQFRGPCDPVHVTSGEVDPADADIAREFYRFASDPSLGAPFADGAIWAGIEEGPAAVAVGEAERADLGAWEIDTAYAERSGPFSALDLLARSGGYYELAGGVNAGCFTDKGTRPTKLVGLRAISFAAPSDTVSSCLEWWSVTLFLNDQHEIQGVSLRLGSP